jgi:glycosyltransferase involved in cell wall biosynthesis
MGGEAILPLHYLRELTAQGLDVTLVTHARCRTELSAGRYANYDLRFVEDGAGEQAIWWANNNVPGFNRGLADMAIGLAGLSNLTRSVGRIVRDAARRGEAYDVLHQVTPVSPRSPSYTPSAPAPLVIAPLNGNMAYPKGFERYAEGTNLATSAARIVSVGVDRVMPGKRRAACVLVANARTTAGLPPGVSPTRVETLVENGVDLAQWGPPKPLDPSSRDFVFVGRLVHWKALDLAIEALARVPGARLRVFGDGPKRPQWETLAARRGIANRVTFEGFRPQAEVRTALAEARALLLPSLYECGGAVVLEAMAAGRTAAATNWGGPADYITHGETGLLIEPRSPSAMTDGLADAIALLMGDDALTARMGWAGRAQVERHYSWEAKARKVIGIYQAVSARAETTGRVGGTTQPLLRHEAVREVDELRLAS